MPARLFARVPTMLVGIVTSKEVPFATRSLVAKNVISKGTAIIPPPIPNRPEAIPM